MDAQRIVEIVQANAAVFRQLVEALEVRDATLTKDFSLHEFENGNTLTPEQRANVTELAQNLQVLRDHLNAPIRIHSGVRSQAQNEAAGGAKNSQHLIGTAADFSVQGRTPAQVRAAVEQLITQGKMKQGGLSAYATHVHYDTRGIRARW
jgi:uncharacterized protein YcbK (DUF882 family)